MNIILTRIFKILKIVGYTDDPLHVGATVSESSFALKKKNRMKNYFVVTALRAENRGWYYQQTMGGTL